MELAVTETIEFFFYLHIYMSEDIYGYTKQREILGINLYRCLKCSAGIFFSFTTDQFIRSKTVGQLAFTPLN